MASNSWSRINKIVDEAIRRGPEERPGFLDEACGGSDSIRCEVESFTATNRLRGALYVYFDDCE